ncbi:hypothetical protein K0B96_04060 [Horticoccus luteus]|uniref:Uncharacterized protein n=1 Tax=Horticoccus luteus TaxID=2862869 RepID=A0A8F9TYD6_9BACT|nr:hypothetical protein [Horticoccus luteus]QYM79802.1 hypothetical protein K0B96_04060 [Horticoccus luteus]
MSNPSAKPVSLFTVIAVLVCLGLFFAVAWWTRSPALAPRELAPEGLAADQQWKATPESRKAHLVTLRAEEAKHATTYAWIDQSAGTVQLPIDRAMELTVERYSAKH